MIRKQSIEGRNQFAMLAIDDFVPKDHLIRKIDATVQFDFTYPIVESTYSTHGHPSIDPVVLVKSVFIQCLFGIRSMRQTIKDVETNVAYHWLLGYSFKNPIPHFSTFGKDYVRRFRETTLFEGIFSHILEQAVKTGFVTEGNLYIGSTHIKANADKHKFIKEMAYGQTRAYQGELENEINRERTAVGKRPFTRDTESELSLQKISHSGPESDYCVKGEQEKQFAYSAHTSCEDNGLILSTLVTPGNVYNGQVAIDLIKQSRRAFPNIKRVVADAGYKAPKFVHFLLHLKFYPVLPYTVPHGVKGMFRKKDFVYDAYFDRYLCPDNQSLLSSTITRDGCRTYKSNPKFYRGCPLLGNYTLSTRHRKVVVRHVWANLVDELERQHHTALNEEICEKRKQTIERIFADAKEKYGMRWTKYRGLEKVATHAILAFAAMNLKGLTAWLWKAKKPMAFYLKFLQRLIRRS